MRSGDNGTLTFWDYDTGTAFQNLDDIPQPGSLEAEAGVFCSTFDATGTRLITGGADKTIKVYYILPSTLCVCVLTFGTDLCGTITIVACTLCIYRHAVALSSTHGRRYLNFFGSGSCTFSCHAMNIGSSMYPRKLGQ